VCPRQSADGGGATGGDGRVDAVREEDEATLKGGEHEDSEQQAERGDAQAASKWHTRGVYRPDLTG
jgi:hypothetical protein